MNKLNLLLTSLVVAIPGAILAVLLVMAFLNHGGGPNVAFQGLAGLSLLVGASMAALPGAVLVFVKGDLKSPAAAKPKKKKADVEEEEAPAEEGGDDFEMGAQEELPDDDALADTSAPEEDLGNDMDVDDFLDRSSVEEQDMMVINADSSSEADEFPMDDMDDLFGDDSDDDAPKKKKKKK